MIVLYRTAKKCIENAVNSRRISLTSNVRVWLMQCNVHLNKVYDVDASPSEQLPQWSALEFYAADAICWMLAFLERLGCKNIDMLIEDVVSYRQQHPDLSRKQFG